MPITGNNKLSGVFGWNIALEWGRKWALKRKNSRKNILVFYSLAKSAMNWCLVAVFSHWYWVHLWEKLQEDIPETAWKNTEVFLWSIKVLHMAILLCAFDDFYSWYRLQIFRSERMLQDKIENVNLVTWPHHNRRFESLKFWKTDKKSGLFVQFQEAKSPKICCKE